MFQKILEWIKGVLKKMIGQPSIKQAVGVDVALSTDMANALYLWSLMYANKATWLNSDVRSAGIPSAIASDIARSVTIEMSVGITGSPRADWIAAQFRQVMDKIREKVECGVAKGGLMMKPYINGRNISIDFIEADQFYPVAFNSNGDITACVFVDQRTVGDQYLTRLEYHTMTPDGCVVQNFAYRSFTRDTLGYQIALSDVDDWKNLEPTATITGIDRPLFAYFRNPGANFIDPASPLGVSCFSRAVQLIEEADRQWSRFLWEFESGERALYVDSLAFGKDKNNKPILPNKKLYRTLNGGGNVDDDALFKDWSPSIRVDEILKGFDAICKKIEYACGLAYGTVSDPATVDKTATEIKISRQRSYATITDTQKALQNALERLIWAMDVWATIGNLAPRGEYSAVFNFDDSVVVDKEAQQVRDRGDVTLGVMSKVEYRMRNYGEDEKTAREKIAMANEEQPADPFSKGA